MEWKYSTMWHAVSFWKYRGFSSYREAVKLSDNMDQEPDSLDSSCITLVFLVRSSVKWDTESICLIE